MTYQEHLLKAAYTYFCRVETISTMKPKVVKRFGKEPLQVLIPFQNVHEITAETLKGLIKAHFDLRSSSLRDR